MKVELFDGVLKFNYWLLLINTIVLIWYLVGWYNQYRRTGSYIDYWRFNMFLVFFIPVLVMYPFSSANLNVFAVLGYDNLYTIEKYSDKAYIVTMIGFTGVYIGKYAYDVYRPVMAVEAIIKPFAISLGRLFIAVTKSTSVIRIFSTFYVMVLCGFVYFAATSGLIKNPREFFKLNTQFAPIYTLILSTFEFVFLAISTRALQYGKTVDKVLLLSFVFFGFFLGVRAPLILQGLSFGVLYVLYRNKGYFPFIKVIFIIVVTLVIVMVLAFIRNTSKIDNIDPNLAIISFIPEIFYGNTFSDLRDFSWVLGNWDGELYWGLSYFAAFMSFIPSSIYPIREAYGIGRITVKAAGLDTVTHPGLRMGIFGEMYINFGIIGVIIFGFLWGYVLRRLSVLTKKYASNGDVIKASSVILYSSFVSYLTVSAGFWNFYISTFLLIVLFISSRIQFNK
ncbi:O-antigen polymerase [Spirosoma montaniterrae]|uniref:Oligosaccharide repeat unit polymerase n=1 Tax=Spirosoma montaniterrae TaxID=1178516 RepID=A0A1P9X158_9BACT|nr:O-antigen polymerase [Spirosoma montaniterrae]AQG81315.1 hypothetical protein AWR27_19520 [Spirosoma montaniterrae]